MFRTNVFILLHKVVEIMRKIEGVGAHFHGLPAKTKAQVAVLVGLLMGDGVLQPERLLGQYGHFITQFYIVVDFLWFGYRKLGNFAEH